MGWSGWLQAYAGAVWSMYWPLLMLLLCAALFEQLLPDRLRAEPDQPIGPFVFNALWHAVYLAVFVVLTWSAWGRGVAEAANWFGAPWLPLPQGGGVAGDILRALPALLVFDFLAYWLHRSQHALPLFWPVHRMHHDERHMNASTGLRQQWMQLIFAQLVLLLPLSWLFGRDALNPIVYWVPIAVSVWQHMNVRLEMGRYTPLIMGPQLHRLHHSTAPADYNSNYATLLPLWDKLFGTYRAPARGEYGPTGINGTAPTTSFVRAFFLPLTDWWRMSAAPRPPGAGTAQGGGGARRVRARRKRARR